MRIYIATGLEMASEARDLAATLESMGHTITYPWWTHGSVQRDGPERIAEVAEREAEGVMVADLFVALLPGGRGTHTELGMALACSAIDGRVWRVCVVGPLAGDDGIECAFYRHPRVIRFPTVKDFLGCTSLVCSRQHVAQPYWEASRYR